MFQIWEIGGSPRPYSPRVNRIAPAKRVAGKEISSEKNLSPEYKAAIAHYQSTPDQAQQPAIYASDVMTSPAISIPDSSTVAHVSEVMTQTRYRHLPVINESKRPVGIVSDRDVLRCTIRALKERIDLDSIPVTQVMATELLTALPDTGIRDIARLMFDEHVGSIPVVSEDGELLGIITRSDILRSVLKHGPLTLWA